MNPVGSGWVWFLQSAMGGGVLLLLAWVLTRRQGQPDRQQRVAEWGLAAALLLAGLSFAPAWLIINLPMPSEPAVATVAPSVSSFPEPISEPTVPNASSTTESNLWIPDFNPTLPVDAGFVDPQYTQASTVPPVESAGNVESSQSSVDVTPPPQPATALKETPADLAPRVSVLADWPIWVGAAYGLGVILFLAHWLIGQVALWRLLRGAFAAPESIQARFDTIARDCRARLLVSDRLRVPLSCGLFRPTVVVPWALCEPGAERELGWVLAHELTHIRRRDAWASLLFNIGRVVYFYLPWFWWLRSRERLCQEYIADRAAAPVEDAADYAQFLLGLLRAPALPAGATGVSGNSSDLFRRISMLLNSRDSVEKRGTRLFAIAAASSFVAISVLLSGVGLRAYDVDPTKKEVDKKDKINQDDNKKDDTKKKDVKKDDTDPEKPINPEDVDQLRRQIETLQRQQMEEMRKMMQKMQDAQRARNPGALLPPAIIGGGAAGGGLNLVPMKPAFGVVPDELFGEHVSREGRLGVMVDKPSSTLAEQLDLPKGQGLVVTQVNADSAAAKAGIKSHDILLELNGKSVPNETHELMKILADIKPDKPVDAVVLRKGKKETIKGLTLPEAKPAAELNPLGGGLGGGRLELPNVPVIPPGGGNFLPVIPPNAGPGIGIGRFPGAGAANTVMTTTFRTNDRYTTRHQEGSLIITVSGTVADGKAKTGEIQVQDGTKTEKYESVDKVPEAYRDKVKNLIEMSEKGNAKIEIKSP
jgi:beta-lactamase regulating signal transducer with metallopeptidase domain